MDFTFTPREDLFRQEVRAWLAATPPPFFRPLRAVEIAAKAGIGTGQEFASFVRYHRPWFERRSQYYSGHQRWLYRLSSAGRAALDERVSEKGTT